jgi:ribonuclease P protein component
LWVIRALADRPDAADPADSLPASTPGQAAAQPLAGYAREFRLLKPAQFEQVFKLNERARTDTLLVMAQPNQFAGARLGMVIAKRLLPRAVDRNRVKRCIRETFRVQRAHLPACDFVVRLIARPSEGKEAADLARTLVRAGQRAMNKWPTSINTEHPTPHG